MRKKMSAKIEKKKKNSPPLADYENYQKFVEAKYNCILLCEML